MTPATPETDCVNPLQVVLFHAVVTALDGGIVHPESLQLAGFAEPCAAGAQHTFAVVDEVPAASTADTGMLVDEAALATG